MESQIELYDSDIFVIEEALRVINSFKHTMGFGEFTDAVEHEFGTRGFTTRVVWVFPDGTPDGTEVPDGMLEIYLAAKRGQSMPAPSPSIVITGRVNPITEFDHERMSFEVQRDILGIDTPGALTKGGIITPSKSVSFSQKG